MIRKFARVARGNFWRLRQCVDAPWKIQLDGWPRVSRGAARVRIVMGDGVRLFRGVAFYLDGDEAEVVLGSGTYLNRRVEICCKSSVSIGSHCAVSWDVVITDSDYHSIDGSPETAPVDIGDHVWIGSGARILKGVRIGNGAVVAAGAVVVDEVAPCTIVGGVPARPIGTAQSWV